MAKASSKPSLTGLFHRGEYQEVLRRSVDSAAARWDAREIGTVIGALSFVGRIEEAELLFRQKGPALSPAQTVQARFFLGIGYTRQSQYAVARGYFAENLRQSRAKIGPESLFFVWQGLSFYRYFCGRLPAASRASARSFEAALQAGFLYGKVLSADIRGHILVQLGEVSEGLQTLSRARELARRLGNGSIPEAIEISILIYRSQFGLEGKRTLEKLQAMGRRLASQDTYSRSNLLLELARQLLIRGRFKEAAAALDQAAQIVYATQNRRHEAVLNLRYAYLLYLTGEHGQALSFVRAGKKSLDPAVDHLLELELLGMECKLMNALGLVDQQQLVLRRIQDKSRLHGGFVNRRILYRQLNQPSLPGRKSLDPLGDLIDLMAADRDAALDEILGAGYFALLPELLGLPRSASALYLDLVPGSLTAFDKGRIGHSDGLTPLLRKVILVLSAGNGSKKGLIESVWGYRYHPLRHDPVVYSAVTALRKLLGDHGAWIETTEVGYRLSPGVALHAHRLSEPAPVPREMAPSDAASLNFRQIKLLRYLDKNEFVDVQACKRMFEVSDITASRDLSALTASRLVVRIGRGRAIRYAKPGRVP